MSALDVRGLSVQYDAGPRTVTAVDDVDLSIPSGQVLGLVGESGSGKSTLARAIVGLTPITAGSVLLDGDRLVPAPGRRRGSSRLPVQLIFQDPLASLDPRMTVGQSIGEAISVRGKARQAVRSEVGRALGEVGLDPGMEGLLPRDLSGGQRQRVAIARALAARPSVLIADEITSALDVSVQGSILNLLREIRTELNLTMLFISHNLAVVRCVADTIAVMYCGKVVETAAADELTNAPRHPYTRSLLASVPSLRPRSSPADPLPEGEPADPHDPPSGCSFHPRCPVGPAVRADRSMCRDRDPSLDSAERPHRVSCFFPLPTPAIDAVNVRP
jgi:peptide/nickel transport system ATP-binding protein